MTEAISPNQSVIMLFHNIHIFLEQVGLREATMLPGRCRETKICFVPSSCWVVDCYFYFVNISLIFVLMKYTIMDCSSSLSLDFHTHLPMCCCTFFSSTRSPAISLCQVDLCLVIFPVACLYLLPRPTSKQAFIIILSFNNISSLRLPKYVCVLQ